MRRWGRGRVGLKGRKGPQGVRRVSLGQRQKSQRGRGLVLVLPGTARGRRVGLQLGRRVQKWTLQCRRALGQAHWGSQRGGERGRGQAWGEGQEGEVTAEGAAGGAAGAPAGEGSKERRGTEPVPPSFLPPGPDSSLVLELGLLHPALLAAGPGTASASTGGSLCHCCWDACQCESHPLACLFVCSWCLFAFFSGT